MATPIFLDAWRKSAQAREIPEEGYNPDVKVVGDATGKSSFTFGIIHNPYRYNRPRESGGLACPLCDVVREVEQNPELDLATIPIDKHFAVVANKYPTVEGHALAIHRGTGDNEAPMFTTASLGKLEEYLADVALFSTLNGLQALHNGAKAGATIPWHEHWNLLNAETLYDCVGRDYGIDASPTTDVGYGVSMLADYPFAHIIFNQLHSERVSGLLKNMQSGIGSRYKCGFVPHVLCYASPGSMIVPLKVSQEKGMGAGDIAGHITCKTEEEFHALDYDACIRKLGEILYKKEELDMTAFLE
ncbi:MAG: hypothetical protein MUF61_00870 [archaeon]|jgi:hypothetical protein|nr:hypothetical protein [archaeon]